MLIRAITIRASSHGGLNPASGIVGLDEKVRRCLASRLRARRVESSAFPARFMRRASAVQSLTP